MYILAGNLECVRLRICPYVSLSSNNISKHFIENIIGKGVKVKMLVRQHIFPFPTMFSKGILLKNHKPLDCLVKALT